MARVLIADDEAAYLDVFCEGLQAKGHEVTGVTDGDQLLARLKVAEYDLVFIDVVMAGGGAITLSHAIERVVPGMPVVVITGRMELIESSLLREGLRSTVAKVHKTASLDQLDQIVRRHASRAVGAGE